MLFKCQYLIVYIFYFRYPFNDSEHASLFVKISRGQFLLPDWLSCKARCLVRSLLRREPSERLTADDVLYHPWLTQSAPVSGTSAGDQEPPAFSFGLIHQRHSHSSSFTAQPHTNLSDQIVPVWTSPDSNSDDDN